jgi:hypothetical protein
VKLLLLALAFDARDVVGERFLFGNKSVGGCNELRQAVLLVLDNLQKLMKNMAMSREFLTHSNFQINSTTVVRYMRTLTRSFCSALKFCSAPLTEPQKPRGPSLGDAMVTVAGGGELISGEIKRRLPPELGSLVRVVFSGTWGCDWSFGTTI